MSNPDSYPAIDSIDSDEIVRWTMIFETLSIEHTEPFFAEMGLSFLDASLIRPVARQFLQQIEEIQDEVAAENQLFQQTFSKIQKETTFEVANKLYQWGKWVYASKRQTQLYSWSVLLPWLAGLYRTHVPIVRPELDQNKIDRIIQTTLDIFADNLELDRRLEEAQKLPKSEWEEYLYLRSNDKKYSPLMLAGTIVTDYKVQRIWNLIHSLLSEAELEVFLEWARENAPRLQLNVEAIKLPTSLEL